MRIIIISDNCITEEGASIAEESQLHLTQALQYSLQQSHRHKPTTFGALLLIIPELRTLSHVFTYDLNLRLQQLLEIQEVLNPVMKEAFSPEGRAYELLSNDAVKHMCKGISLEEYENKNKTKNRKSPIVTKKKLVTVTKEFKLPPNIEEFTFFNPPNITSDKINVGWSLRADIYQDDEEDDDSQ